MEKVFNDIFLYKGWQGEGTISGPGSTIEATKNIRRFLSNLGQINIIDCPCGDFNWMKLVAEKFNNYYGIDIVKDIINNNNKRYSKDNIYFIHGSLDNYDFSTINAEYMLIRDCLVHMSLQDIISVFKNIIKSNAKKIMITHFNDNRLFKDINTGEWRPINFCMPPFNFPSPHYLLNEECKECNGIFADKSIGVWDMQVIKDFIAKYDKIK